MRVGEPIRVSIVDDDSVVRSTLRLMIARLPDYRLVSTHASADDALGVLPDVSPSIVLLDIRMPGMSGIDCARRLRRRIPDIRIVMVTAHLEDALVASAFKAGAIGYVVKPFKPEEIAEALDHARRGVIHLEEAVSDRFSAWMRERQASMEQVLTAREVEVLTGVKRGLSDKEIAGSLSLSEHTVKCHVRNILEKLNVNCRSGAVSAYFGIF